MSIEALNSQFSEANCRRLGIEVVKLMFPEEGDVEAESIGKSVCEGCVAFEPCDELGKTVELHNDGIYAGRTRHERENRKRAVQREGRKYRGR